MRYLTEVTFRSKMELVLEGLGTTVYRYMHEMFPCNDQMQACHRVGVREAARCKRTTESAYAVARWHAKI